MFNRSGFHEADVACTMDTNYYRTSQNQSMILVLEKQPEGAADGSDQEN